MSHTHYLTAEGSASLPNTGSSSSAPAQTAPDILAFSYDSSLVYVTPGESYDQAIESAQDAFPELRDVDRDLICLEVRVIVNNQTQHKRARISRTAWPVVLPTLVRYEIVHVRVASPLHANAVSQPPPYASEGSCVTDNDAKGPQPSSNSHSRPKSLTTRVIELFFSRSR
ncbi:hypothetical protein BGW80DRAFT_1223530 [Lactifluus volemus]|nr:hypothetical protein BGW80DRAFT_1223530 [Lactifluus volemus]